MKNIRICFQDEQGSKILYVYATNSAVAVHTAVWTAKFLLLKLVWGTTHKTLLFAAFQMSGVWTLQAFFKDFVLYNAIFSCFGIVIISNSSHLQHSLGISFISNYSAVDSIVVVSITQCLMQDCTRVLQSSISLWKLSCHNTAAYRAYWSFCYSSSACSFLCPAQLWAAYPTLPQLPTLFPKAGQCCLLSPCLVFLFHFLAEWGVTNWCLNPGLWACVFFFCWDCGPWGKKDDIPSPPVYLVVHCPRHWEVLALL